MAIRRWRARRVKGVVWTTRDLSYDAWIDDIADANLTAEQVLFEVPPNAVVLEILDKYGLERWERYCIQGEYKYSV